MKHAVMIVFVLGALFAGGCGGIPEPVVYPHDNYGYTGYGNGYGDESLADTLHEMCGAYPSDDCVEAYYVMVSQVAYDENITTYDIAGDAAYTDPALIQTCGYDPDPACTLIYYDVVLGVDDTYDDDNTYDSGPATCHGEVLPEGATACGNW